VDHFKYIIIGGGMTADAAVKGIRELDDSGVILMLSSEPDPPYNRPPLTKGLWKNTPVEKIWKKTDEKNAEIRLNTTVNSIDPGNDTVLLSTGDKLTYEKLLLATGGKIMKLPLEDNEIIYYRTYQDYNRLREITESKKDFAVIGGGFIGTEIAAALAMNGKKVTMIFPGKLIGERIFPADLAEYVSTYYKDKGVGFITGDSVKTIEVSGEKKKLITENGKTLITDAVIAGIGIKPDTALAESAGIITGNGILVDEFLRTNLESVYAAGDCANFYNPLLRKRIRVEHEDNANKMGYFAGKNMAGAETPYDYLPFFYSDMFELGYEAVGELDPKIEMYPDWKDKFKEGVVYYLAEGRVRGVLLWNVWGQVDEARKLIGEKGPFKPGDLKGRLPVKKEK
jgi:NADPH-dependent 2,4-dienoyl-CoA reductase/sulfur reductase-like enzyme